MATVPDAPTNLQVAAPIPNTNSAHLSWNAAIEHGSPVTSYKIRVMPGVGSQYTVDISGNITNGSTPNLLFNVVYSFQVAAVCSLGTGPYSAAVTGFSLIGAPFPPTRLFAVQLPPSNTSTQGSIALYWNVPASLNGSTLFSYSIEATVGGILQTPVIDTQSTVATYVIHYAFYGSSYSFRAIANSNYGQSPWSNPSTSVTVYPSAPNAPTNVSAASVTGESRATIYWNEPILNGSAATAHTITIQDITPNG